MGTKNTASEEAVSRTVETRNAAARAMSARKSNFGTVPSRTR